MDTSNNLSVLRCFDTSNDSTATDALDLLSLPFITPPAFDTRIKRHLSPPALYGLPPSFFLLFLKDTSHPVPGIRKVRQTHAPWTDFQQASCDWAPCLRLVFVCVFSFLAQLLSVVDYGTHQRL
jgi:hypothetical protein